MGNEGFELGLDKSCELRSRALYDDLLQFEERLDSEIMKKASGPSNRGQSANDRAITDFPSDRCLDMLTGEQLPPIC